jgi:hypothetical protein
LRRVARTDLLRPASLPGKRQRIRTLVNADHRERTRMSADEDEGSSIRENPR